VSARNLKARGASARSTEVSTITRQVDLRVRDDVALDEIELYAEVLSAVAASDGPLSSTELDAVLGVGPGPRPRLAAAGHDRKRAITGSAGDSTARGKVTSAGT
jgi:hypothetical protein